MQLAAEQPELYEKARPHDYALSLNEDERLRQWLLPRRRQLLLEVGASLVKNYAQLKLDDPEDPDMDDLELKAEKLVDLSISHCADEKQSVLTALELKGFMRRAGLNSRFIAKQLAKIPVQSKSSSSPLATP